MISEFTTAYNEDEVLQHLVSDNCLLPDWILNYDNIEDINFGIQIILSRLFVKSDFTRKALETNYQIRQTELSRRENRQILANSFLQTLTLINESSILSDLVIETNLQINAEPSHYLHMIEDEKRVGVRYIDQSTGLGRKDNHGQLRISSKGTPVILFNNIGIDNVVEIAHEYGAFLYLDKLGAFKDLDKIRSLEKRTKQFFENINGKLNYVLFWLDLIMLGEFKGVLEFQKFQ